MLVEFLTKTSGGGSKLGLLFQRGLKVLRQTIQGRNEAAKVEPKLQNGISKASPIVQARIKSCIREVLENQFTKNQTSTLVSHMRQRYGFRLMSGFRTWNIKCGNFRGLAQTVARYGFVGVAFAGGSQFTPADNKTNDDLGEDVGSIFNEDAINWNILENVEYVYLLARAHSNVQVQHTDNESLSSEDSDIIILDGDNEMVQAPISDSESLSSEDSDIIILNGDNEMAQVSDSDDSEEVDVLMQLIGRLERKQQMDLFIRLQEHVYREGSEDGEILFPEAVDELTTVKNNLDEALCLIESQNRQLLYLREIASKQNLTLKHLMGQPIQHVRHETISADLEPDIDGTSTPESSDVSFEIVSRSLLKNGKLSFDMIIGAGSDGNLSWPSGIHWNPGKEMN